jgi:hypothetical protein
MSRDKELVSDYREEYQLDPYTVAIDYYTERGVYKTKVLTIPVMFREVRFCLGLIEYFKRSKLCTSTKKSKVFWVVAFFDFLTIKFNAEDIPADVMARYVKYLSDERNCNANTLRECCSAMRTILKWAAAQSSFSALSEKERNYCSKMIKNIPSIPTDDENSSSRLALSQLIVGYEVDDFILLESLNRFCFVFLSIMQRHRSILLNDSEVQNFLSVLKSRGEGQIGNLAWKATGVELNLFKVIFDAVLKSSDATLKERLLCSCKMYRTTLTKSDIFLKAEDLDEKLKSCLWQKGSLKQYSSTSDGGLCVTFENFDFKSLLEATPAEEICLRWLLAVDRIQGAGQKTLEIDDFEITPTHCTILYEKNRSSNRIKSSTAFRRGTWQYKIYSYYVNLKSSLNASFPESGTKLFFSHSTPFARPQYIGSISYRLFGIACLPCSHLAAEIICDAPTSRHFIGLLKKVLNRNSLYAGYPVTLIPDSSDPAIFEDIRINYSVCITPGVIAQSRAIVDDDETPANTPYDRYSKEQVDADSTAHNPKTKAFIYRARSETVHRKNKRVLFSNAVNDLQETDARRLVELMGETKLFTISQMKKTLKYAANHFDNDSIVEFNQLVEAAIGEGYSCSPFGSLQFHNTNEQIIIVSPVTVALMLSYRDACDDEIRDSESKERTIAIRLQSLHISLILEEVDAATLLKGNQIHSRRPFPKPLII